jgi:hypothetical protein
MSEDTHFDAEFLKRWPYMAKCDECNGCVVQPRPPNLSRFRLFRRWVWRIMTVNGSITYALNRYNVTWMAATGLVMAAAWTDFLRKHVEGLFNDGTNDLPLMWNQLGFVLAITAVCTILPALVANLDYAYHSRFIPVHRRVFRQRFTRLMEELVKDEAYAPTHEWDYDSDGCPDAQFEWFRRLDTKKDAVDYAVSREIVLRTQIAHSYSKPLLSAIPRPIILRRDKRGKILKTEV